MAMIADWPMTIDQSKGVESRSPIVDIYFQSIDIKSMDTLLYFLFLMFCTVQTSQANQNVWNTKNWRRKIYIYEYSLMAYLQNQLNSLEKKILGHIYFSPQSALKKSSSDYFLAHRKRCQRSKVTACTICNIWGLLKIH